MLLLYKAEQGSTLKSAEIPNMVTLKYICTVDGAFNISKEQPSFLLYLQNQLRNGIGEPGTWLWTFSMKRYCFLFNYML